MSYIHKWVNDEARYFSVDSSGSAYEHLNKPTYKHRFGLQARWESGGKMWSVPDNFNDANPACSLQQRYTTQQMELEKQGWTLWNAGDCMPDVNPELMIDIHDKKGSDVNTVCEPFGDFSWLSGMNAIAYRLSNADGYKDGVKVEYTTRSLDDCPKNMIEGSELSQVAAMKVDSYADLDRSTINSGELLNIGPKDVIEGATLEKYITVKISPVKPEWKAGELPPVGTVCEFDHTIEGWVKCTAIGMDRILMVCVWGDCEYSSGKALDYRPIQTDKERVIAKAMSISGLRARDGAKEVYGELYDAGMRFMPKGEE